MGRIKEAWRVWRAYRKGKKMVTMKPIYKSKTTATVAASTGTTAGVILAILTVLRGRVDLPWGKDGDAAIVAVLTTVLGPLLSRLIAKYRKGATDPANTAVLGLLIAGMAGLLLLGAAGCNTLQVIGPDGDVVEIRREPDRVLIEQLSALILNPDLYRQGWELYSDIAEWKHEMRVSKSREQQEVLALKIQTAQQALDALVETAESLRESVD